MPLFEEAGRWLFAVLILVGVLAAFVTSATSYRVRNGRRTNMLAAHLKLGCLVGIATILFGLLIAWLATYAS